MTTTDVAPYDPDELIELRSRLVLIERALSRQVNPAAAPPIVIGPFDNVPAPGSPIRSDWPQEISTLVTQHISQIADNVTLVRLGAAEYLSNVMILAGTTTVATDVAGVFNLLFPVNRTFVGSAPVVFCNYWGTNPWRATVTNTGATGFTGIAHNEAGVAIPSMGTFPVQWGAIGVSVT